METKMHNDEMIEHSKGGGMEAGFGGVEDSKMMKRVVLKMDFRYSCCPSRTQIWRGQDD
jgi:hypothetical protein